MKIQVTGEAGRECNPHPHVPGITHWDWNIFDATVQSFPAPGIEDGEHEAELGIQERFAGMWHTLESKEEMSPVGTWRQIWKLTPKAK